MGGFRPLVVAALALLFVTPAAAGTFDLEEPDGWVVHQSTLPNGLHVIVIEDHRLPVVGVDLLWRVGTRDERDGSEGEFAHLVEHLLFRAGPDGGDYIETIEALGGWTNAITAPDWTRYLTIAPAAALGVVLELERDRQANLASRITELELALEKTVVMAELEQQILDQPMAASMLAARNLRYGRFHPYHRDLDVRLRTLQSGSLHDVLAFHRTWYVPGVASLAIVGDVQAEATLAQVERTLGRLPAVEPPARRAPLKENRPSGDLEVLPEMKTRRTMLTWPAPPLGHEHEQHFRALEDVLSTGLFPLLPLGLLTEESAIHWATAHYTAEELGGTFTISVDSEETLRDVGVRRSLDAVFLLLLEIERGKNEDRVIGHHRLAWALEPYLRSDGPIAVATTANDLWLQGRPAEQIVRPRVHRPTGAGLANAIRDYLLDEVPSIYVLTPHDDDPPVAEPLD